MNIVSLAEYVIKKFSAASPDGISPMKLQKLLYYVKAWSLVADQPLVNEPFERWDFGPVNPSIYYRYKSFGKSSIEPKKDIEISMTKSQQHLVNFIVHNYVAYDAISLSNLTHSEAPWQQTSKNEVISDNDIKEYYSSQEFAKNFIPFNLKTNTFYALNQDSFTLDMSQKDRANALKYSSYAQYNRYLKKAEKDFERLSRESFIS